MSSPARLRATLSSATQRAVASAQRLAVVSEAGFVVQSVEGLTCLRILSLMSGSCFHLAPQTGSIRKRGQEYQEKSPGVRICTPRASLHFHLVCPHTRPLTSLNQFLLCHTAIVSSVLPSWRALASCKMLTWKCAVCRPDRYKRLIFEYLESNPVFWSGCLWFLSFKSTLFYVSITKQVVPVCVANDESLIPYNDNKHCLLGTYYLARSCGVYFIYIIFF